ncbi:MAG: hypothetical protein H0V91_09320 [Flavisolibacter sp.]|nr:hypothetical protein [Flavisolibacter sp.]
MKKHISNLKKNTTLNFFILTLFLLFNPFSNTLQAQGAIKSGDEIYVNYVGTSGGQPVFLVRFNNKDKHYEHLRISNKEGLILYKEKLIEENFTKRFQIDIPFEESVELILSFSDKEGKQIQKYVVNSNMLMVRNVEVTKL